MRFQAENSSNPPCAGLYIHVPFCVRKCGYCDFYSITDLREMDAFVDALTKEMHLSTAPAAAFDTIYIGGGTPSLLKHAGLMRILDSARKEFSFTQDVELTIEVNPGTVSFDSLKGFSAIGVNRVNLGIQSFDDEQLHFLGRVHSAKEARQSIDLAQAAGVENLGLDLMYGLPNQSRKGWLQDLKEAVGCQPEHISCYMLTYAKGTPLYGRLKAGSFCALDQAAVSDLFGLTVDFLSHAGYEQYEISNFSRGDSSRSRHNQKYWSHNPYIGLGPAAHSFIEPKRWWNHRSLGKYLEAVHHGMLPVDGSEDLNRAQLMMESIFLSLRTQYGIDIPQFEDRYKVDFLQHFKAPLEKLRPQGMLTVGYDRCALSRQGMIFADAIAGMFADHIVTDSS
ncbi:MAG: radical SAM family heme chaperone HemW [Desulfobacterales bacterium]|nr:radical SAM family heme chaperone HemW [Desulfobacterales bacterium]